MIDHKNIEQRVLNAVGEQFRVDKKAVELDSHLIDDLAMDSLDAIEIVMRIEEEFCIEIADIDAEKCTAVSEIVNLVEGYLARRDAKKLASQI